MPSSGVRTVFLAPGVRTQVIWSSFQFYSYTVTFPVPAVNIGWSRGSTLPPFATGGVHSSSLPFSAVVAGAYCEFHMTSPVGMTVTIR